MEHVVKITDKIEEFLALGGVKKEITVLVISGVSLLLSIFHVFARLPFDIAWVAIILCGVPILLEAIIGMVTRFDIRADVLVSLALIASVATGELFAAGEVAFIMSIGGLLEDLTAARAREGIEKLVHLTPQSARLLEGETERVIPAEEVREGDALERLAKVKKMAFDKTGTLTYGEPKVTDLVVTDPAYSREEIYRLAARMEQYSEHPLGKAIAGELGIGEVHAECLPEDKLHWIAHSEEEEEAVCMIGDGVNDAPALKRAMVGIAMGGVGSDIAVDAADIALVDDEVKELPHLIGLSRRMMRKIRGNLTFSLSLNFLAIILAITGILGPMLGALVHKMRGVCSSSSTARCCFAGR